MRRFFVSTLVVMLCCWLASQARVHAQDDTYTLGFSGPASVSGNAGEMVSAEHFATLTHAGTGPSAQGWSIGVAADGGAIVSATIDGTAAGGLFSGGFNNTSLTTGPDNEGAVSAIVLSFVESLSLPPNETASILALGVDWTIPQEDGTGTLRYPDGLVGGGQPVVNVVTVEGSSVPHDRASLDVQLDVVVSCCDAEYRVGFSSEVLSNATPGEGIADGDPERCLAAGGGH